MHRSSMSFFLKTLLNIRIGILDKSPVNCMLYLNGFSCIKVFRIHRVPVSFGYLPDIAEGQIILYPVLIF